MADVNYSSILAMESNFPESKKRALEETDDAPFLKKEVKDEVKEEENKKEEMEEDKNWHRIKD